MLGRNDNKGDWVISGAKLLKLERFKTRKTAKVYVEEPWRLC